MVIGVADHLEIWNTEALGRRTTPRSTRRRPRSPRSWPAAPAGRRSELGRLEMATLTLHAHRARSSPGPRADRRSSTPARRDRGRLHLRRRRPRPAGRRAPRARRDAGLHRPRPRGRGALRTSSPTELELRDPVRARGLRRRPRRLCGAEGVRADVVYMDLGVSSLQLDAAERGFSYTYDAPLDMRMDPDQALSAADGRQRVARGPARRGRSASTGRSATRARSPREIVRRRPLRDHGRAGRGDSRGGAARLPVRPRASRQADLPGDPDRRQRRARSLDRALPAAWDLLREGGRLAAISFHSLEDRRVKRFLARSRPRLRLPAGAPGVRCGREPEAELLTRRALAATPEEIERNPRSHSARLRVARKLHEGRATPTTKQEDS